MRPRATRCKRCDTPLHTLNKARRRALCERCLVLEREEYNAAQAAMKAEARYYRRVSRVYEIIGTAQGRVK